MSDWYGHARTNYFRVKDQAAFEKAVEGLEVELFTDNNDPTKVGLLGGDQFGDFPTSILVELDDGDWDYDDIDIVHLVADHLADDEVAIFMTVGAEKLRYLTGRAVAINNKHETQVVDLDQIYTLASKLGPNVTQASY